MFKSVAELNEAIKQHRKNNELTRTELAVLDVLAQYSCVEPGVSYLRKSKIGEAIGRSRRTVIRVCKRLESLGIIRQYKRMRETGDKRQTSNIIVIQPIDKIDTCQNKPVTRDMSLQETPSINSKNNTLDNNGALKRAVHAPIYDAMKPYFNDGELYQVIGILYRAKATVDKLITVEDYATEFIDAFKSVVRAYKLGKVRSLFGCLYKAWREVSIEIKRKITVNNSGLFYDWLSDSCDNVVR